MHPLTLKEAIFPVVQENNCIFIGLTTPNKTDSPMHQLLNTVGPDGVPVITTIRIGKPCDECVAKKILCMHSKDATPEGTSKKKRLRFKPLYASDMNSYMREFQGQVAEDETNLFHTDWLISLAARSAKPVVGPIDFLLMSIDPAQGGKCEWGTCICYYDLAGSGCQVVVQLDTYLQEDLSPASLKNWLLMTLSCVRSAHQEFRRIPIVIACEAAPKIIGLQLQGYLSELINEGRVSDVIMMNELDAKGLAEAGVPKTNQNTQLMVKYTQNLLETKRVAFSEVLRSCVSGKSGEDMKQEYLKQMRSIHLEPTITPSGKTILKITGKGHGANDDLGVAVMMNAYWYERFYLNTNNRAYTSVKSLSNSWRRGRYVKFFHALLDQHTVDEIRDVDPFNPETKRPRLEVL